MAGKGFIEIDGREYELQDAYANADEVHGKWGPAAAALGYEGDPVEFEVVINRAPALLRVVPTRITTSALYYGEDRGGGFVGSV